MIKANEVRVGNWVRNYSSDKSWFIDDIVTGHWDPFSELYSRAEGIPLTPEILEKCGFEKNRSDEYVYSMQPDFHLSISFYKTGIFPMLIKDSEFSNGEAQAIGLQKINYLHQLQNLYFALTGEELNFTP